MCKIIRCLIRFACALIMAALMKVYNPKSNLFVNNRGCERNYPAFRVGKGRQSKVGFA